MAKKRMFIGVSTFLLVILALFGTYKLMNARSVQLFGELTFRADTDEKKIAITFDDGPSSNIKEILPLLEKYNAKATFFLIGEEIEDNMEFTKSIVNAGHQVGNHTYSHQRMIFKSPSTIKEEIEKTDSLIREAGFKDEIDFRPPNGKSLCYYRIIYKKRTATPLCGILSQIVTILSLLIK